MNEQFKNDSYFQATVDQQRGQQKKLSLILTDDDKREL